MKAMRQQTVRLVYRTSCKHGHPKKRNCTYTVFPTIYCVDHHNISARIRILQGTLHQRFDAGSILNGWIIEKRLSRHSIFREIICQPIVVDISLLVAALSLMLSLELGLNDNVRGAQDPTDRAFHGTTVPDLVCTGPRTFRQHKKVMTAARHSGVSSDHRTTRRVHAQTTVDRISIVNFKIFVIY